MGLQGPRAEKVQGWGAVGAPRKGAVQEQRPPVLLLL